jgi:methionyl-tRNA formyltransferase
LNPLKELALARNLFVLQPELIKSPESVARLQELNIDLCVVAAYGQILSKAVLAIPRLGTINIHSSLLPKYRGATPIHAAVLNGDAISGVTIIELVPKMDAGPILGSVSTPIQAGETTGQLEKRLAELAVPLTLKVINEIADGTVVKIPQDESQVTHVHKLTKLDGLIPWAKSAAEVECHVRGMQPWPSPFSQLCQTNLDPIRLQILSVKPCVEEKISSDQPPGTIVKVTPNDIVVQCGTGAVSILTVQPDGKRAMPTGDFLRGRKVVVGDRFV